MRRIIVRLGAALAGIALAGTAAQAQQFDASLSYTAREEVKLPDREGEFDNDIMLATVGVSWGVGDGRMRAGFELGFTNNDDWNDDYSSVYGGELLFARRVGNQRYGLGGRVRVFEEQTTSTEIAYAIEQLGETFDLRGLAGLQVLADDDKVPGRDGTALFVQGEVTFYPSDALAVSAGLMASSDGEAYGLGVEYRPSGWAPSFFLEYAAAIDTYRETYHDSDRYDALTGGIRIVPGTSSLKTQRQASLGRVMYRFFQPQ